MSISALAHIHAAFILHICMHCVSMPYYSRIYICKYSYRFTHDKRNTQNEGLDSRVKPTCTCTGDICNYLYIFTHDKRNTE